MQTANSPATSDSRPSIQARKTPFDTRAFWVRVAWQFSNLALAQFLKLTLTIFLGHKSTSSAPCTFGSESATGISRLFQSSSCKKAHVISAAVFRTAMRFVSNRPSRLSGVRKRMEGLSRISAFCGFVVKGFSLKHFGRLLPITIGMHIRGTDDSPLAGLSRKHRTVLPLQKRPPVNLDRCLRTTTLKFFKRKGALHADS